MLSVCMYFLFAAASVTGLTLDGAPCRDGDTNSAGYCTSLEKCVNARNNLQQYKIAPAVCEKSDDGEALICCTNFVPEQTSKVLKLVDYLRGSTEAGANKDGERINERKCEEYTQPIGTISADSNEKLGARKTCMRPDPGRPGIVGGDEALPDEFPHMAQLGWKYKGTFYRYGCGAVLVAPKFSLTAAHCFFRPERFPLANAVRFGQYKDGANVRFKNEEKIVHIITTKNYTNTSVYEDIAVVEIKNPLAITSSIRPACLWNSFGWGGHTSAVASGWGITHDGEKISAPTLRKVSLELLTNKFCGPYFQKTTRFPGFIDSQMCAGHMAGGKNTCHGDSGGPLQVTFIKDDQSCHYYVMGIISIGIGASCEIPNNPGICTRVFSFLDWIETKVWGKE